MNSYKKGIIYETYNLGSSESKEESNIHTAHMDYLFSNNNGPMIFALQEVSRRLLEYLEINYEGCFSATQMCGIQRDHSTCCYGKDRRRCKSYRCVETLQEKWIVTAWTEHFDLIDIIKPCVMKSKYSNYELGRRISDWIVLRDGDNALHYVLNVHFQVPKVERGHSYHAKTKIQLRPLLDERDNFIQSRKLKNYVKAGVIMGDFNMEPRGMNALLSDFNQSLSKNYNYINTNEHTNYDIAKKESFKLDYVLIKFKIPYLKGFSYEYSLEEDILPRETIMDHNQVRLIFKYRYN